MLDQNYFFLKHTNSKSVRSTIYNFSEMSIIPNYRTPWTAYHEIKIYEGKVPSGIQFNSSKSDM